MPDRPLLAPRRKGKGPRPEARTSGLVPGTTRHGSPVRKLTGAARSPNPMGRKILSTISGHSVIVFPVARVGISVKYSANEVLAMERATKRRKAFTLIEMMVVVTIIAILAVLIVPMINKAQQNAMTTKCKGLCKAIAKSVYSYATGWEFNTSPDPGFFVKDFGYKLSYENGYDADFAAAADHFKCPVDDSPIMSTHGYPTSYSLTSAFIDSNIGSIRGDTTSALLLVETGKRHPAAGKGAKDRHYTFGDGHVELGWNRGPLSGLVGNWWNEGSSNWGTIRDDTYSTPSDFEGVWSRDLEELSFAFLPNTGKSGNWGTAQGSGVDNIVMRLEGLIRFPESGTWYFVTYCDDACLVGVDLNKDKSLSGGEIVETAGGFRISLVATNVDRQVFYKCMFMFREGSGANYFRFFWTQDASALSDPTNVPKKLVPGAALFHIP